MIFSRKQKIEGNYEIKKMFVLSLERERENEWLFFNNQLEKFFERYETSKRSFNINEFNENDIFLICKSFFLG